MGEPRLWSQRTDPSSLSWSPLFETRTTLIIRDVGKTLDAFDFDFNRKLNRRLVFELATGRFVTQHEDGLFLGPPGTGKSHLAQALGVAVIQQGHRVLYREAHTLVDELADAQLAGTRKATLAHLTTIALRPSRCQSAPRHRHHDAPDAARSPWRRVRQLRGPHVRVVEEPIEERGDSGGVAEQLAPVLDGAIRGDQRRGAAHHDLQKALGRGRGESAHAEVVDDEQLGAPRSRRGG
jgi:hypothetical protein